MKKLLTILLTIVTLSACAQVNTLPPDTKAYGNRVYLGPGMGKIYFGTAPLKFRAAYTDDQVDSLLGLVVDTTLFVRKTSLPSGVRATLLTGLSSAIGGEPLPTDNVLQGLGKFRNFFINIGSYVRSTNLVGLTAGTNTPITSSNTVLQGLANLQAQISAIPTGTLTSVTTGSGNNITPNVLFVSGVSNIGTPTDVVGMYRSGGTGVITNWVGTDAAASLLLREETGILAGAELTTRLKGVEAINSDEVPTLAQVTTTLGGYVPYTGATTNVNLGSNNISAGTGTFGGNVSVPVANQFGVGTGTTNSAYLSQGSVSLYNTLGELTQLTPDGLRFETPSTTTEVILVRNVAQTSGTGIDVVLPPISGTLALISDIPSLTGYVTIATSQTVTGNKDFSGNTNFYGTGSFDVDNDNISLAKLTVNGRGGGSPLKPFMIMNPAGTTNVSPTSTDIPTGFDAFVLYGKRIADGTSHLSWKVRKVGSTDLADYGGSLVQPTLTADREWALPDASGTIALVGDLSNYITTNTTQTGLSGSKTFISGVNHTYGSFASDYTNIATGEIQMSQPGSNKSMILNSQYLRFLNASGEYYIKGSSVSPGFFEATLPAAVGTITVLASDAAPSTSSSTGNPGTVIISGGFMYVCIGTNSWVRSAVSTF